MFNGSTDREWEKFGRDDPYFSVISDDKFRERNLTDENREDFFRSGYVYIDTICTKSREHIDPTFTIKQALDFGCGVGRLVIPLSDVAETVTGVDVSDSMLDEAKKNCETRSIKNVILVKSDDNLSSLTGKYDFIHSFIVFQHIPVPRGERIFKNLIDHLEDGGICVVHFTYAKVHRIRKLVSLVKNNVPLAKNFVNLIKGREFVAPQMQMNSYNLNRLFLVMQQSNVCECYFEYTNHGGELGVILYFKKRQ
ncbi:MAG: class I SAM-dependent methyltransferase [Candidatus Eisenbacteria bacterium]